MPLSGTLKGITLKVESETVRLSALFKMAVWLIVDKLSHLNSMLLLVYRLQVKNTLVKP